MPTSNHVIVAASLVFCPCSSIGDSFEWLIQIKVIANQPIHKLNQKKKKKKKTMLKNKMFRIIIVDHRSNDKSDKNEPIIRM